MINLSLRGAEAAYEMYKSDRIHLCEHIGGQWFEMFSVIVVNSLNVMITVNIIYRGCHDCIYMHISTGVTQKVKFT